MGVVNYDSIGGELYGDSESGQYLRDALGSVTATAQAAKGYVFNSYRYRPSGLPLSSLGAEPEPKFKWVGTAGYRDTPMSHSQNYVRARHYGQNESRWTTVDPLWPGQPAYCYVNNRLVALTDPSGRTPWEACPEPPLSSMKAAWDNLKARMEPICKDKARQKQIEDCWVKAHEPDPPHWERKCFCQHGTRQEPVDFACYKGGPCRTPPAWGGAPGGHCMGADRGGIWTPCRIRICPDNCWDGIDFEAAFFHELMHCCNANEGKNGRLGLPADSDILERCLRPIFGWTTPPDWPGGLDEPPPTACDLNGNLVRY